eukprot:CAMPEP_0201552926 /NCGR_PEP_ID=MMETSP0173_2-20130828/19344_1 /ASSEMBLY_ACC=CAM_ASM_000268 /TAXON_ID=218659 /ORGANISM="Vexillifera sp., Strain DIVA3 564/2" /LENGTH=276 /DNA_ID=CAMNT_0047963515 /DNA_START=108 /DNA_END=938 /DNA_ORIENTATION=-
MGFHSSSFCASSRLEQIRQIRDASSAPLLDCKKALDERGDVEGALEWLREKGISTTARAGRVAADGVIATALNDTKSVGAMVQLNSETDFVSRLADFQQLVHSIADRTMTNIPESNSVSVDQVLEYGLGGASPQTVQESIAALMYKTGEKIELSRVETFNGADNCVLGAYVHGAGKHASLVQLEFDSEPTDRQMVAQLAHNIATQVTGFSPQFIERNDASNLDDHEKLDENLFLLEQSFFNQPEKTVGQVIEETSSKANAPIRVAKFTRWSVNDEQ